MCVRTRAPWAVGEPEWRTAPSVRNILGVYSWTKLILKLRTFYTWKVLYETRGGCGLLQP